jgi:hypothetical protein
MVRIISICLALVMFQLSPAVVLAHNPENRDRDSNSARHEAIGEHSGHKENRERRIEESEKGDEFTGQMTAWLLVLANVNVVINIFARFVNRFVDPSSHLRISMNGLNQIQSRYLRKLHYLLNPLALSSALLHFSLSSCRSSSLPEWGLFFTAMMVVLGLMLKFKVFFKWTRRAIYRLHTAPAIIPVMILLLLVGHLSAD